MKKYNFNFKLLSALLLILLLSISCKKQLVKNINEKHTQLTENTISLSPAQIQLANIKVFQAKEGVFSYDRQFTGVLKVNEESSANISSRAAGRVIKFFIKNVGEYVNKGDSLYQFYSEDLISAEKQFFNIQSNNWNYNGKYEPSLALENKLLLLGMFPAQIEKLRKDGKVRFTVTILSPVKGVVRAIDISEGQFVNSGQTLLELADDTKLWVEAQVHPEDLGFLKVGMVSFITIPDAGNRLIKSTVSFINPSFERGKNVTAIRSEIENMNKKLYPGMLVLMHVKSEKNGCVIIPSTAVISDKNGSSVWIQNENNTFSARNITTGLQSDDSVQVISGLSKSEFVVTSGAYLLNSELILRKGNIAEAKN
jgi:Cu(I)/Ag(I) efflux system membrane fusion protein